MEFEKRKFEVLLIKNHPDMSLLELEFNQNALQQVILQAETLQSSFKSSSLITLLSKPEKAVPKVKEKRTLLSFLRSFLGSD